jgi:riboflavin biosynthesis pyrimidine reductase
VTFYRVFPDPRLAIDPETDAGITQLNSLYNVSPEPSVRVNMIVRPNGSTTGSDGTSASISSASDRALLRLIRAMADVVIIGAETLRRERIPLPDNIPLVVLSTSGNIAANNIVSSPHSGELVVVTSAVDAAAQALGTHPHRIIDPGHPSPSAEQIVALCRAQGWNRLLVEGGQQITTLFADAGVVDDVCLTLTGAPQSEETPPVDWWPKVSSWATAHLLMDDDRMLYHRYTKESSA